LDVGTVPNLFWGKDTGAIAETQQVQKHIDENFEILRNPVDLGTLVEGQYLTVEVPIKYTGEVPVSVELAFENPLVALDYSSSANVTSRSKNLLLLVSTVNWDGPFNLPLPVKLRSQAAVVERTILVRGDVFVPIAFRQDPPNGPIEEGRQFSVFVRNNTQEEIGIRFISVDAKFDVLKEPKVLIPDQESEVVLRLRASATPDRLNIALDRPLHGRDTYSYRFRDVRRR
jgi:hypothetical protein